MIRYVVVSVALGAVLSGCGGAPPPNDKMSAAEAASRGAREVGADQVPAASLHLRLADEQIAKAKTAIANDDNENARMLLIRAQADAELALALARENKARGEAQAALDQVAKIRGGGTK
jgi:hypothetical protein